MATLLTIPGEIRNQTYDLALPKNTTCYFQADRYNHEGGPPGICRASRQLREETLPIWCSSNRFVTHQYFANYPYDMSNDAFRRFCLPWDAGFKHIQHLTWIQVWRGSQQFDVRSFDHARITLVIKHSECCITTQKTSNRSMDEESGREVDALEEAEVQKFVCLVGRLLERELKVVERESITVS
ncbi:hypothetical protein LTR37_001607 [Vermiconidia calcicola]|uniref:Uncharacterized protein n=1 Tax=Vermiconidia calcicola TaxID=1690605 RepID=A0ACC3NY22_9PEZI|nr:hypothetical protein LTR37_001607 [Vermiconidia calcicola]